MIYMVVPAFFLWHDAAPARVSRSIDVPRCDNLHPHEVIAAWYGWWGDEPAHHWADASEGENGPRVGGYNSQNISIVDQQLRLAESAGITVFATSWWGRGTFTDASTATLLHMAERHCVRVAAYYERVMSRGEANVEDAAVDDILYLLDRYSRSSAWFRVGGRPVIFAYARAARALSADQWQDVRRRIENAGHRVMLIADRGDVNAVVQQNLSHQPNAFDGSQFYDLASSIAGQDLHDATDFAEIWSLRLAASTPRREPSIFTITPGYDDRSLSRRGPHPFVPRLQGNTYSALWKAAVTANPDWVFITSWNEWHEGTEIEPSRESDDMYVNITARFSRSFMNGSRTDRAVALAHAQERCLRLYGANGAQGSVQKQTPLNGQHSIDDATFLNLLYRCMLWREPDQHGREYYLNMLHSRFTRQDVWDEVTTSSEYRSRVGALYWSIAAGPERAATRLRGEYSLEPPR